MALDSFDETLRVTRLPFSDRGGTGTWTRFARCGEALWLVAIAHPSDPRLQAVRVEPELDPRPRDLGRHSNLGWEQVHWTCDGEDLLVVHWSELYELR